MKLKHKPKEPDPPLGSTRTVVRFLWWPERFGDETRWLEFATIIQEFVPTLAECFVPGEFEGVWIDKNWAS